MFVKWHKWKICKANNNTHHHHRNGYSMSERCSIDFPLLFFSQCTTHTHTMQLFNTMFNTLDAQVRLQSVSIIYMHICTSIYTIKSSNVWNRIISETLGWSAKILRRVKKNFGFQLREGESVRDNIVIYIKQYKAHSREMGHLLNG